MLAPPSALQRLGSCGARAGRARRAWPRCRLLPYCGDGEVHAPQESCDDANTDDRDACPGTCRSAICGDGVVWEGVEACDPKTDTNCTEECARPTCGDGLLQGDEACDDGNKDPGDDCLDTMPSAASMAGMGHSLVPGRDGYEDLSARDALNTTHVVYRLCDAEARLALRGQPLRGPPTPTCSTHWRATTRRKRCSPGRLELLRVTRCRLPLGKRQGAVFHK